MHVRQTRRKFALTSIYLLNGIMAGLVTVPTLFYLFAPPRRRRTRAFIDVGDISALKPGVPLELHYQRSRYDGWRFTTETKTVWVVKNNGSVTAFKPSCTHLGCAYHWETNSASFACPCHGSYFSIEGDVLAGPAPRPLDRYPTKVNSCRLQINDAADQLKG
jgi:quinol---cytochrome c reductase iron-sulfur subunit, bacillus type